MKENIEMKGNDTEQCKKRQNSRLYHTTATLPHYLTASPTCCPTAHSLTPFLSHSPTVPPANSITPTVQLSHSLLAHCLTPQFPVSLLCCPPSLWPSFSRCPTVSLPHYLSAYCLTDCCLASCCTTVFLPPCQSATMSHWHTVSVPTAHCFTPNFPMSRCLTAPL